MELISVIVPVYKVEAYLDKCVQSIVDQTYKNLEIILVDDGSPDRCGAMCDAWAVKDSRIKVIHKPNGGLSDARNAGMEIASGEYMGFVDSDDHISRDMYRLLLEHMTSDGSDIAACGVEMVFEDGTPSRMLTPAGSHILNNTQAMEAIIREDLLKQPVWYKLYRTEMIQDIPFAIGKYHEDVFWSWQAIARIKKVSIFDTPCYYYLQRGSSIMGQGYSLKRFDAWEAKLLRMDYLQEHMPTQISTASYNLWLSALYMGQMAIKYLNAAEQKIAFQMLLQGLSKYPLEKADLSGIPVRHRCWVKLSRISLPLTCRIRNLLRIGQ